MKRLLIALCSLATASVYAVDVFPDKEGFDRYGGYLAHKGKATGRFHLDTIDGRHFLITPGGHGFVSISVTHTMALGRLDETKFDHLQQNLGDDWDKANTELLAYFRKWGYNSLGYGGHKTTRKLLPYFASCDPTVNVSSWMGKAVEYPDVFSETWKQRASNRIESMVKAFGDDPNQIGIYWTDMPAWDLKRAKRRIGMNWVDAIRALPDEAPGKQRYERFLRENGANAPDADFLVLIAREIYSHIGPLTRQLAPNTLIFGERYAGAALPWRVIQEALPWIDVVSVQPGACDFWGTDFDRLYRETKKPIMIYDHQCSFNTPEHKNVMWNTLPDVASVGRAHAKYVDDGFATPYLIGYSRCQYIDRYKAGQKILKQGLLRADGTPYKALVESVEKNNWQVHQRFLDTGGEKK